MFRRKTVFVIGAGCSMEYGLPNGLSLRRLILKAIPKEGGALVSSPPGQAYLQRHGGDIQGLIDCSRRIHEGLMTKPSVDQYLETHSTNEPLVFLGKLAIASAILSLEEDIKEDIFSRQNGYLEPLSFALNDKVMLADLGKAFENVTFLTFNYDRIIETYLFASIGRLSGGMSPQEVSKVTSKLNVMHVYGQAGLHPLQSGDGLSSGLPKIPFGGKFSAETLTMVASNLRTFSEGLEDPLVKAKIATALSEAEQVLMMGFSYLPENMKIIENACPQLKRLSLLTWQMSEPDRNSAMTAARSALGAGPKGRPGPGGIWIAQQTEFLQTANQFMWDNYRTLIQ